MDMNQLIEEINALAHKNKTVGLTDEEVKLRDDLRKEYLKRFRANFIQTMENTTFEYEDGVKVKMTEFKKNKEDRDK